MKSLVFKSAAIKNTPRRVYLYSFLVIMLHVLFVSQSLVAQDNPQMLMEISADTIALNQVLKVQYTIRGVAGELISPETQGLRPLGGPSQSYSMTMINGVTRRELVMSYSFIPERTGDVTLGAATIKSAGTVYSFPSLTVYVGEEDPNIDPLPSRLYTYYRDGVTKKPKPSKMIKL